MMCRYVTFVMENRRQGLQYDDVENIVFHGDRHTLGDIFPGQSDRLLTLSLVDPPEPSLHRKVMNYFCRRLKRQ